VDQNTLYYGDNLDVLRRHIKDETVDLEYLDPPFNSNATYNVLFAEHSGAKAAAQVKAFEDTWGWDDVAARSCQEMIEAGGKPSEAIQAFKQLLGQSNMMAYLAMMAPRLVELRRVLKPTGSIYLHCDPTSSHYLKMLMDAVFGPARFQSEIIWKRTSAHSGANRPAAVHDVILLYSKSEAYIWNQQYQVYAPEYLETFYEMQDPDGRRWKRTDLTGAGVTKDGPTGKPWRGIDVTAKGRHWACAPEELDRLDAAGLIHWPKRISGMPRLKQYVDAMLGVPIQDIWTDIRPLHNLAAERLGYPTQKPVALLERILLASSNPGGLVLDPFCGCGTTVDAAQQQGRRWIGIDITQAAIVVIKKRLQDTYGDAANYKVIGEPVTVPDAMALAAQDPYQFQWWSLGLLGARPVEQKKGSDKGIDGRLYFHDEGPAGKTKQVILSVKAGHTGPTHVRDLHGVLDAETAELGVLITVNEPTQPMRAAATDAGFYTSPWDGVSYPKLQILTVAQLLDGRGIAMPSINQLSSTFKRAPKAKSKQGETLAMPLGSAGV
jgi:DNA modification methylase